MSATGRLMDYDELAGLLLYYLHFLHARLCLKIEFGCSIGSKNRGDFALFFKYNCDHMW